MSTKRKSEPPTFVATVLVPAAAVLLLICVALEIYREGNIVGGVLLSLLCALVLYASGFGLGFAAAEDWESDDNEDKKTGGPE